ncbi:hypothetical protein E1A91_D07G093200v1 [Gossypium mustelinum]|uniref:Rapid ALkalinization Factor n=1 Tax=Gossypium mustelinum TaxID=34275 RepID=A0A5D2U8U4_GOSMU|nr:hypothetical protein E1A91_D07G093200v1 [Gossypium mustelinum]
MGFIEREKHIFFLLFSVITFLLNITHPTAAFIAFDLELEWELDMVMNSNIVRMLQSGSATITGSTGNANEPSQKNCPEPSYGSSLPATGSNPNCNGIYCRQDS